MQTTVIYVRKDDPCEDFLNSLALSSKRLYNRVLFLIRNVMTGLAKPENERHELEQEAIDDVCRGLENARQSLILKGKTPEGLDNPTPESPNLSYRKLEAALRYMEDSDYRSLPAHTAQHVIKKVCEAMKSFYGDMKAYAEKPSAFAGKPKLPKYLRKDKYVVPFTNQTATLKEKDGKYYIEFPKSGKLRICLGDGSAINGRYIKAEAVPEGERIKLCVTYESDETEINIPKQPKRILGIDTGVDNFAAGTFNFDAAPFIISGKYLKSENRRYNMVKGRLRSELDRDPGAGKTSHRLESLSVRHSNRMRDFMYKAAHSICRIAAKEKADVIVIGKNPGIKNAMSMGKQNNQNFQYIPFAKFCNILKLVSERKYGIPVVIREESYTSQASLKDGDCIPTYGTDDKNASFSGKRKYRGLYEYSDGTEVNADINAAGNILRKEYPDAFSGISDFSFLSRTIRRIDEYDLFSNKNVSALKSV